MSISPTNPPSPKGISPPKEKKQKRHSRNRKKYYGETAWETLRLVHATWILAGITILVFGGAAYQIYLTQEALELTRTALTNASISDSLQRIKDSLQLAETRKSANAQDTFQAQQIGIANIQTSIANKQMHASLQAFMDLKPMAIDSVNSHDSLKIFFHYELENIGQTPAYSVIRKDWGFDYSDPNWSESVLGSLNDSSYGMITRSMSLPFRMQIVLNPYKARQLIANRAKLYFRGEIRYRDIFGVNRFFRFRYRVYRRFDDYWIQPEKLEDDSGY
jgi:hypothetical protein